MIVRDKKFMAASFIKFHLFKKTALPCILTAPCQNGATCTNNNLGGYSCSCLTGYTGTNCQYGLKSFNLWLILNTFYSKSTTYFKINKALPCNLGGPCKNGAGCTNDNLGSYTCSCASGYTGINCQYGNLKLKIKKVPLRELNYALLAMKTSSSSLVILASQALLVTFRIN